MSDRGANRREFLESATAIGLGLVGARRVVAGEARASSYRPPTGFVSPVIDPVRIGFVGVGLQGGSHVQNFLRIEGVEIVAVCDIDESRAREVADWVAADQRPAPDLSTRGEWDFRRLCERDRFLVVLKPSVGEPPTSSF